MMGFLENPDLSLHSCRRSQEINCCAFDPAQYHTVSIRFPLLAGREATCFKLQCMPSFSRMPSPRAVGTLTKDLTSMNHMADFVTGWLTHPIIRIRWYTISMDPYQCALWIGNACGSKARYSFAALETFRLADAKEWAGGSSKGTPVIVE